MFKASVSNHIHIQEYGVIIHPYPNFKDGLTTQLVPPHKEWVMRKVYPCNDVIMEPANPGQTNPHAEGYPASATSVSKHEIASVNIMGL